jgi:hypothetical protein
MSQVTNIILSMGSQDEDEDKRKIQEVNAFFEGEQKGFVLVNDEDSPFHGWYGGSKFFAGDVAIGAFNYLHLKKFIEHIQTLKWEMPDEVQLIVREQDDTRFRIINVFDEVEQ